MLYTGPLFQKMMRLMSKKAPAWCALGMTQMPDGAEYVGKLPDAMRSLYGHLYDLSIQIVHVKEKIKEAISEGDVLLLELLNEEHLVMCREQAYVQSFIFLMLVDLYPQIFLHTCFVSKNWELYRLSRLITPCLQQGEVALEQSEFEKNLEWRERYK